MRGNLSCCSDTEANIAWPSVHELAEANFDALGAPHADAPGQNADMVPSRPASHRWRRDALLPCCSYL